MNKVIFMGRLTADPEIRYSQGANQTAIARFSLAVNRKFKRDNEPDADFFNCTCFGKQAEFVERYLSKGIKVLLSGRIENNNYENRDGQMVYSVRVMVEEIEFAESKSSQGNNAAPAPASNSMTGAGDGFMNLPDGIDDSELPFD